MPRLFHNVHVLARRAMVRIVQLVPARWRAWLSRNPALTRLYEYFDDARYEPLLDAADYDAWLSDGKRLLDAMPLRAYRYPEPELTRERREQCAAFAAQPLISIILPVFDAPAALIDQAVQSVITQWYGHWELCLVDDHSSDPGTVAFVASIRHPRVKTRRLSANQGVTIASNAALELASGEYIALLDHDDVLTPDALFRVVECINREAPDFIYSDEDKIDPRGRYTGPHYKPGYAPDTLLSQNYISHLGVMRRSLVEAVGGFAPGLEGAQDYDLYLKVLEKANRIAHLPKVLYHWRQSEGSTAGEFSGKDYAQAAGQRALEAAIRRRGLAARVEPGLHEGTYRVRYALAGQPLVSIIIPFRDKPELLAQCVDSILSRSSYRNFEIIGMDNRSRDPRVAELVRALTARDGRVRFETWDAPFSFSAINNFAVRRHARGEHVVLLNNDIEVITPDWIESLLEHSQREEIGTVGAKLYYPDGSIQHAGIVVGIGGLAGHSHKHAKAGSPGYFARLRIVQNVSAVTAACLMVKKRLYEEIGGLDEQHLAIAFNDVDFGLRLLEAGFRNIFTPYCEAIHHESSSRGQEDTPEKRARFAAEVAYARKRHARILGDGDPYYNPNLTLDREDFSLKASAHRFAVN